MPVVAFCSGRPLPLPPGTGTGKRILIVERRACAKLRGSLNPFPKLMSAPEQPTTTLMLSVNCIHDGCFYPAGTPLPFTDESALPESLKPFVATAAAPPPEPVQRNIYDLPLSIRRQVGKLELAAAEKEWAEAQASEPLREDVAAALEDAHAAHVGRAKAQLKHNQDVVDAAYKAAQAPEPPQLYVRRGLFCGGGVCGQGAAHPAARRAG